MAKKEYKCPHCNNINQLILMGYSSGTFEKICPSCNSKLEITLKDNKINILVETKKERTVKHAKVPKEYAKYDGGNDIFKNKPTRNNAKNIIAILVTISSLSGFATGGLLMDFFSDDYNEFNDIKIEIPQIKIGKKSEKPNNKDNSPEIA